MFAGINKIGDIDVTYSTLLSVQPYIQVLLWEPGLVGHVSIDLLPEKARELIEKLQAALPPIADAQWPEVEPQPIVAAQAQPDLETDLPAPVAVDDIPW